MPRWVEFLVALTAILVLSPLFLIIAVLIKLDSSGPVFFKAARAGRGGKPFSMYKFRTMVEQASAIGPPITTKGDRRITRMGRILRLTKLDELPQLLNVVSGSMRLVGPRPEFIGITETYSEEERRILAFKPGITSPASLAFYDEESMIPAEGWSQTYRETILPRKIAIDLAYCEHATAISDLILIFRTLFSLRQDRSTS